MNGASLIDARERGIPFDRILRAIESNRESISALPSDQVDFLESMLCEVKKAVVEFEQAVRDDNLDTVKKTSESMLEIFSMVKDSCESCSGSNK